MNLESVRVTLWDVRAQWESGVRRLTTTQSAVEQWQSERCGNGDGNVKLLQGDLSALKEINITVKGLLEQVERALAEI